MTIEKAMNIIQTERTCVLRANICNRDCGKCELVMETLDIIEAYDIAIDALIYYLRSFKMENNNGN